MSNPSTEQIDAIWASATAQRRGIRVPTSDPPRLLEMLIASRLALADPNLWQFTLQVKNGEVWIVRSKALPEVKVNGDYQPLE